MRCEERGHGGAQQWACGAIAALASRECNGWALMEVMSDACQMCRMSAQFHLLSHSCDMLPRQCEEDLIGQLGKICADDTAKQQVPSAAFCDAWS